MKVAAVWFAIIAFVHGDSQCCSSDECGNGFCNMDWGTGGWCELCPTTDPDEVDYNCEVVGYNDSKGTDECKKVCPG